MAGGVVLLLLLGGGVLLLTRGSDDETVSSSGTTNTGASPATSTRLGTSTSTAAAVGDFTKPGAQLKFGEKALVPATSKGVNGTWGVTATGIKKGNPADLAPLNLGDQAAGLTPYYVTFVVTNESGTDFAYASSAGQVGGLLGDGKKARGVTGSGTFPPCQRGSGGKDFTTKGATFTTCTITLAGGTSAVTGASYGGSGGGPGNNEYLTKPITWK